MLQTQQEKGLIIITERNGVCSIRSVTKENWSNCFLDYCKLLCSNWESYSSEDIEDILDEGLFKTGKRIVAVIWLDDDGNYDT